MQDKTFELLEKMYSEFTDFRKETNERFDKLENQVTKTQLDVENNINPTQNLILEKLDTVNEKLIEHDSRFNSIESKIESQDVEIQILKRAK